MSDLGRPQRTIGTPAPLTIPAYPPKEREPEPEKVPA
jgi:hypothetical protein